MGVANLITIPYGSTLIEMISFQLGLIPGRLVCVVSFMQYIAVGL